jgi:hypothetical protein
LQGIFPNSKQALPAGINGIGDNKTETTVDTELTKRAENAVTSWFEIDKDAVILLENIVKLAKTNQAMYKQAKTMLMNL